MRIKDKIKNGIKTFIHSFAWGMKSADREILEASSLSIDPGVKVEKEIIQQSVYEDLLNEQETERVKELRDKYYRIYIESGNYNGDLKLVWDDDDNDWNFTVENMKKETIDVIKKRHPKIECGDNFRLLQAQEVFKEENPLIAYNKYNERNNDKDSLIEFIYDTKPRFYTDNYLSMIVIKDGDNDNNREIEMYFKFDNSYSDPAYYIFFNKLNESIKYGHRHDFLSPDEIYFTTMNSYGDYDLREYKYKDVKFFKMTKFEDYYVAHCTAIPVIEGNDLSEKFRLKDVSKKYENCEAKGNVVPLEAAIRKMNKDGQKVDNI